MTTKVTVDAHAGWPVLVVGAQGETDKSIISRVVEPNTVTTFYIHSGFRIINIEELPRNDK